MKMYAQMDLEVNKSKGQISPKKHDALALAKEDRLLADQTKGSILNYYFNS